MPHVSVHYKIYLIAGHHRQPRNTSAELEPNPPSEVDVTNPGNITPLYIPQLPSCQTERRNSLNCCSGALRMARMARRILRVRSPNRSARIR